jgi:hypothetical protein
VLKINLLPPYIYERRKVRKAALIFGLLFAAVAAGIFGWWLMLSNQERNLKVQVEDMKAKAAQVEALQQQLSAEQAKLPPIKSKVDYIKGVMAYNMKYPAIYAELANYTYSRIIYKSIKPSGGNSIAIDARARTVGDCGRYLLNMYRAQHIFTSVAISQSAIKGWSSNNQTGAAAMPMVDFEGAPSSQGSTTQQGFDFTVTCALKEAIIPPAYAAGGSAPTGTPGTPGMPGATPPPSAGPMGDMPESGPNL